MPNIVLARIDDRLIHGQVMTAWMQFVKGNHIVIVDDATAGDDFLKSIIRMAVPEAVNLDIFFCKDAPEKLKEISDTDRILMLAKDPEVYLFLIKEGVPIKKVIIGGMGVNPKRTKFYKNIAASETEKESLRSIIHEGIEVVIHIIPDQAEVDVKSYL
ncbi:PTS sugar transporter subunit IIB [Propionispira raffinosivorans]|uniref:PTS sugar transporter subunit IIB n=1 Tax=Propionispira raffinosivorans TaxID=86959 RepID=UPI00037F6A31|nr:PTS sugar transporter subunit IIB [Propionispira raffinosivorans]